MADRINEAGRKSLHKVLDRMIDRYNKEEPLEGMLYMQLQEIRTLENVERTVSHSIVASLEESNDGSLEVESAWLGIEEWDDQDDGSNKDVDITEDVNL
ncbi:hypothetical protein M0R72_16720 [Candidatus Pacearchaeota archaeon]|jgi:hypothetical protein|nr:hypothetical protein [Candidatus Pacearchaeota archaeon]